MREMRLLAVLLAVLAPAATGARLPTQTEARLIRAGLPAYARRIPKRCVHLDIRVANDGRYAKVAPFFLVATQPSCVKYAFDGYWLLQRAPRWRLIYDGSGVPPCVLGVPRDLTPCKSRPG